MISKFSEEELTRNVNSGLEVDRYISEIITANLPFKRMDFDRPIIFAQGPVMIYPRNISFIKNYVQVL